MGGHGKWDWYYENLTVWDCEYYQDPNATRLALDLLDEKERGKNDWIIGVGFSILSTVLSCVGLILQKIAHNQQARLPDDKKYPECGGVVCSPCWWGSFLVMGLIPFPADFIAFSYAAQSIVVPFAGLTIMLNQLIAPCILDEKLTQKDMIASVFVFTGCVVSTAFGAHEANNKSICQLLNLFTEPFFYVALALLACAVALAIWNIKSHASTIELAKNHETHKEDAADKEELVSLKTTKADRPASCKAETIDALENGGEVEEKQSASRFEKVRPFSFALVAGASGGFKTPALRLQESSWSGFEKRDDVASVWKGPYPYFFSSSSSFLLSSRSHGSTRASHNTMLSSCFHFTMPAT